MRMRSVTGAFSSALVACAAATVLSVAFAQELETAVETSEAKNEAARESQQEINGIVEQTDSLESQYTAVGKEVDGLKVYNRLLDRQISDQQEELQRLASSMDRVTSIERQVTPLMIRMIDGLEQFVNLDMPFLMQERTERIERLREMMERADVTVAEKFRRVLEAYQIENEFGRSIEAYKGSLTVEGNERQVDFLRIGRVGLYYQTEDEEHTGRWNEESGGWEELDAGYRRDVRDGLRIARKQAAPDLLMLPLPVAGEVSE